MPAPPVGVEEVTARTDDGLELAGWLRRGDRDEPLLLVFHGNAGTRANRLPLAEALRPHGIAVLLTDYRGYGGNPAPAAAERSTLPDTPRRRRSRATRNHALAALPASPRVLTKVASYALVHTQQAAVATPV